MYPQMAKVLKDFSLNLYFFFFNVIQVGKKTLKQNRFLLIWNVVFSFTLIDVLHTRVLVHYKELHKFIFMTSVFFNYYL